MLNLIKYYYHKIWTFKSILLLLIYRLFLQNFPSRNDPLSLGCRLRYYFLRNRFANCGKLVNIQPNVKFNYLNNISIGNRAGIGSNSIIDSSEKVIIGNDVLIGPELIIYTSNHNINLDKLIIEQGFTCKPVIIGNDVWIGARVIILQGVTIGDGTVIGAGSIVTKDLSSFSVYAGNPAKFIRKR